MPRTIVIRYNANDVVGDETYEAWLKHESDSWELVDAGDMSTPTQDFTFPGLIDGAHYVSQLRMKRAGRYRVGYLDADPETWPSDSRVEFTVGALIDVGAPVVTAVDNWVRTDADHSKFTIHITPDDTTKGLKLYRNNVLIHTFDAPLDDPIVYDDIDPALGIDVSYKAQHFVDTLLGPMSNVITKFSGPAPVTGFDVTSTIGDYGKYSIAWDDDGRHYRVQDDYECNLTNWVDIPGSPFFGVGFVNNISKTFTEVPEGDTQNIVFHVRIRAEVTTFGVTDVSDWDMLLVEMSIDDPDTSGYNSCP